MIKTLEVNIDVENLLKVNFIIDNVEFVPTEGMVFNCEWADYLHKGVN